MQLPLPVQNRVVADAASSIIAARDVDRADAFRIGRRLVLRDAPTRYLLGLEPNGEVAVYYNPSTWSVYRIPIDENGADGRRQRQVEKRKHFQAVDQLVFEMGREAFAWIHPRWRWVFGDW